MTKNTQPNFRYKSEKSSAKSLGMEAIAGSGNNWEKGREDFIGRGNDPRLGQSKSTGKRNAITVRYRDLFQLWVHAHQAQKEFPIYVMDWEQPMVVGDDGEEREFPEHERWVAMPEEDYKRLWEVYCKQE